MKKRAVLLGVMLVFAMLIGCKSATKTAEKLLAEGKYTEAITVLKEDGSEEAKAMLVTCVIEEAEKYADSGDYKQAIACLAEVEQTDETAALSDKYTIQYAMQLADNDDYENALLQLDTLENTDEVNSLRKTYVEDYTKDLLKEEAYEEGKALLESVSDVDYDEVLMRKCNLGILGTVIEENGARGKDGKRFYCQIADGGTVYVENAGDETVVFGYEFENSVGGNDFRLYVDGSDEPYFEAVSELSFMLLGHAVNNTTSGYGTVDIATDSKYTLSMDNYVDGGSVTTSGNTTTILTEADFTDRFNDILSKVMSNVEKTWGQYAPEITLSDLGFCVS